MGGGTARHRVEARGRWLLVFLFLRFDLNPFVFSNGAGSFLYTKGAFVGFICKMSLKIKDVWTFQRRGALN